MLDNQAVSSQSSPERADETRQRGSAQDQPEEYGSIGSTVRELVETVLFILIIFFIVRGLVQNFRIDGSSMEPNLHTDQYILVNKVIYFHFDGNALWRLFPAYRDLPKRVVYPIRMPRRGDIVVLEAPPTDYDATARDYIKRVIGMPGETVLVRDGQVYVDGQELEEPYLAEGQRTDCGSGKLCEPYVVPPGAVVVMGDNRSNSQDSRMWDAEPGLPLEQIVGRAWLSYWPQDRWGIIPAATYAFDTP